MLQGAKKGHGDDRSGDDIKDFTGKTLAECKTAAKDRTSWRILVRRSWSPNFSNVDAMEHADEENI